MSGAPAGGQLAGWEQKYRADADADRRANLPGFSQAVVDRYNQGRSELGAVADVLSKPQLQIGQTATATAAQDSAYNYPITNRRVEQAFVPFIKFASGTNTLNSDFTDVLGPRMALAFRLLQYGAPAVAVGYRGWDTHSGEKTALAQQATSLGRAISALFFLLSAMKGDVAKRKLDEVLVVVVSDYARDGVRTDTGFNDQGGSDHLGTAACRYQVLPVLGAGVKGGRILGGLGYDDHNTTLVASGKIYSTASLCATMIDALGIDSRAFINADPIAELFT
jgi:uncharacterized protein (DUF1501 family)